MNLATIKRWKRDALEDAFESKPSLTHAKRLARLISMIEARTQTVINHGAPMKICKLTWK